MSATTKDDESIVGDECHIVARSPDGPRGNPSIPEKELDDYPNLILLCKTHHELIDDQPNTYTVDKLKEIKQKHEKWVQETLRRASSGREQQKILFARRIITGKDALSIVIGAEAYDFGHDEPENTQELELISGFLQTLQDWGEFGDELEVAARVKAGFDLTQDIKQLDEFGFAVFGVSQQRTFRVGDSPLDLSVAVIRVMRKNNPSIVEFAQKEEHQSNRSA